MVSSMAVAGRKFSGGILSWESFSVSGKMVCPAFVEFVLNFVYSRLNGFPYKGEAFQWIFFLKNVDLVVQILKGIIYWQQEDGPVFWVFFIKAFPTLAQPI